MSENIDRIPYTYLIGWSDIGIYYYGVKFARGCSPRDLWQTYFTSSKHVLRLRKEWSEPDIIEIRRVFKTTTQARAWETKVLQRLRVLDKQETWLNKTTNSSISVESSIEGAQYVKLHKLGICGLSAARRKEVSSMGGKALAIKYPFEVRSEWCKAAGAKGGETRRKQLSKKIVIDGVVYDSITEAIAAFPGIDVFWRLKSPKYINFKYLEQNDPT